MRNKFEKMTAFFTDDSGQVTIEYTLLIAAFGIPMILVFWLMLATLVEHYRMVSGILAFPLP